ncbi:MAG TPA: NfeD family protein [Rhodothermales bacterium]|nr:NfeD family protein [Rhodothermales bacterium]HRR08537.1 NfeD family protein [Rhodothermales bacterium]
MELILPIGLLLLGLFLIWLEIWIVPGLNVVGVGGLLSLAFGIFLIFTGFGLLSGVTALGLTATAGFSLFYFAQKNGAWDKFILQTTLLSGEELAKLEGGERGHYLGKSGIVLTPLRPTGIIEVEGERMEVVTEGGFISSGSKVRIVAMDRQKFFVRLDEQNETSST